MVSLHFARTHTGVVVDLSKRIEKMRTVGKQLSSTIDSKVFERLLTNNDSAKIADVNALMDPIRLLEAVDACKESIVPEAKELIWCVKKGKIDPRDRALFKIFLDFH